MEITTTSIAAREGIAQKANLRQEQAERAAQEQEKAARAEQQVQNERVQRPERAREGRIDLYA